MMFRESRVELELQRRMVERLVEEKRRLEAQIELAART